MCAINLPPTDIYGTMTAYLHCIVFYLPGLLGELLRRDAPGSGATGVCPPLKPAHAATAQLSSIEVGIDVRRLASTSKSLAVKLQLHGHMGELAEDC